MEKRIFFICFSKRNLCSPHTGVTSNRHRTMMAFTAPSVLPHGCVGRVDVGVSGGNRRGVCATAAVDTSAAAAVALSERAQDLRGYLRAHKSLFQPGVGFKAQTAALTRKNDTTRTLIPADELETNAPLLPGLKAAEYVLEHHDRLVEAAIELVPAESDQVADIVRYNVATVLRIVSYAAAAGSVDFLNLNNANIMRQLHIEAGVPATAFAKAIAALSDDVAAGVGDASTAEAVRAAFDTLGKVVCAEE